ncbi:MAG TPA: hypothetical protein VG962_00365 [Steroidobacteraceae bacterium]|nr:hypothetical protein [Steroidobacteraceae bacterium]
MKRSAKAVLLSGLVFPGVGHIYLKRFIPGIVLALIATVATGCLIANATHIAMAVFDKVINGEVAPDATIITNMVSQQSQQVARSSDIATYMLIAAWLIGVIDSYRIGIAVERNGAAPVRHQK